MPHVFRGRITGASILFLMRVDRGQPFPRLHEGSGRTVGPFLGSQVNMSRTGIQVFLYVDMYSVVQNEGSTKASYEMLRARHTTRTCEHGNLNMVGFSDKSMMLL